MKTYEFVAKYGSGYNIRLGYGKRDENGKFKKKAFCTFINAIFQTSDEELAQALLNHPHCGNNKMMGEKIFHLNQTDREVTDRYGKDEELAKILQKKKMQELRSMASKFRGEFGSKHFLSYKKEELIGKLLQNPEKTKQML